MTTHAVEKRTRATNVQVPGEAPKQPEQSHQPEALKQPEPDLIDVHGTSPVAMSAPPAFDMDALRAQIRAEERDQARHEISMQIQAAASVVNQPASASTIAGNRGNYRTMRAADIDHTKLTAPVLSLDGWVCPPAPEAKK